MGCSALVMSCCSSGTFVAACAESVFSVATSRPLVVSTFISMRYREED